MTDSLDKLLRDDDEDDALTTQDVGDNNNMPATPQPLKFDGNRGGGAFEPPNKASMNRLRGRVPGGGVDVHAPSGEGSLHTPKPQRVAGARYGRDEAMMHHRPHPLGHFHDPYANNRGQPVHHDPFFTPLAEDPYRDMHQFGPIPPTVVSPLTIPEYNSYPMHAPSWSPIPPEFGTVRDHHWGQPQQHPPPAEFHPHAAGYDRAYPMPMPPPHNQHPHYHIPGNVSPFMPHYVNQYPPPQPVPYNQQSVPLSPQQAETEKQYTASNELSQGRPRKDSFASVNSGHSSKSVENTLSPQYRSGLQTNSSEEEMNWFVPHSISGETVSRGGAQHGYQQSSLQARSMGYSQEKKQGKKVNSKQSKDGSRQTTQQLNKAFHAKGLRPSTAAANSAASQEFLESPPERAAFKVCLFSTLMVWFHALFSLC